MAASLQKVSQKLRKPSILTKKDVATQTDQEIEEKPLIPQQESLQTEGEMSQ